MANPGELRRALLTLMRAKSLDRSAKKQGLTGGGAEFPTDDYHVRRARQQAQEVQGVDPLAAKPNQGPSVAPYQVLQFIDDAYGQPAAATKMQRAFTERDAVQRATGATVKTTHRDPFRGPEYTQETVLDDIEGAVRREPRSQVEDFSPEVPGSNESITIFEELMQFDLEDFSISKDLQAKMKRLEQIHPEFAAIVKKNLSEPVPGGKLYRQSGASMGELDIPIDEIHF